MISENKNSFFYVRLVPNFDTTFGSNIEKIVVKVEDYFEPVLSRLTASSETYTIYSTTEFKGIVFLFKTLSRKRLSLLRNTVNKYFPSPEERNFKSELDRDKFILESSSVPKIDQIRAMTKTEFITLFRHYQGSSNVKIKGSPMMNDKYIGKDLEIFKTKKNWFAWQRSLYDMLYTEFGSVKTPNDREIVFIEQRCGNVGKSKFLKYLYMRDPINIGLLREGNSGQLNSALAKMFMNSSKKIIFIDLPRTQDHDYNGLCNVVESCKNGIIINHLFGANENLLFEPPHIVIAGNSIPESAFSTDRWKIMTISDSKNKPWKDITKNKVRRLQETIDVQNQISELKLEKEKLKLQNLKKILKKSQR